MIIYLIRNTLDCKGYVGQTTLPLAVRFASHKACHRPDMLISVALDTTPGAPGAGVPGAPSWPEENTEKLGSRCGDSGDPVTYIGRRSR
ncbi:hypothetical protein E1211_17920 [Micromonospora sp. 15K316]|uniref:hypothetical protein n=1 Tax=Micromonospora sp. 15K316 TaxID=2530376 RepID=UPI00104C0C73|nr:hypothetical protein [Micromonospora sp. 15K316]TDC34224.1 hypothetical protein E1211_17920 [Micromonospora sp. 15K316]